MINTISSSNARFRRRLPRLVERLREHDPEGAWSVLEYGNRTEGLAANDNFAVTDTDNPDDPKADVIEVERRHRMRPSPDEMVSSVHRARVITEKRCDGGPGRSRTIIHRYPGYDDTRVEGDRIYLADMVFTTDPRAYRTEAGGLMVSYRDASQKLIPRLPEEQCSLNAVGRPLPGTWKVRRLNLHRSACALPSVTRLRSPKCMTPCHAAKSSIVTGSRKDERSCAI